MIPINSFTTLEDNAQWVERLDGLIPGVKRACWVDGPDPENSQIWIYAWVRFHFIVPSFAA